MHTDSCLARLSLTEVGWGSREGAFAVPHWVYLLLPPPSAAHKVLIHFPQVKQATFQEGSGRTRLYCCLHWPRVAPTPDTDYPS